MYTSSKEDLQETLKSLLCSILEPKTFWLIHEPSCPESMRIPSLPTKSNPKGWLRDNFGDKCSCKEIKIEETNGNAGPVTWTCQEIKALLP